MNGDTPVPDGPRRRYLPLLYRVAGLNAVLLMVAVGATIVVLAPSRGVSSFRVDEEGVLLVAVLLLVVALNVFLVRRIVAPVQTLTALARRVDLTGEGDECVCRRRRRRRANWR